MKEVKADLWDFYGPPGNFVVIPTNCSINVRGELIMGAGVAKQARDKIPGLAKDAGKAVLEYGEMVIFMYQHKVILFPTKHHFREHISDLGLISKSAGELNSLLSCRPFKVYMPHVGCGKGGLTWGQVKPALGDLDRRITVVWGI